MRRAVMTLMTAFLLLPAGSAAASPLGPAAVTTDGATSSAIGCASVPPLADVTGTTHAAAIGCLTSLGVVGGYADGTYRPTTPITRAQFASVVARAVGITAPGRLAEPGEAAPFGDVPLGSTHAPAIARLHGAGVLTGRANGSFGPDEQVTRAQVATVLDRLTGANAPRGTAARFSDVDPRSTHGAAIGRQARKGTILGYADGTFRPERAVTRGQVASLVVRGFNLPRAEGGPDHPGGPGLVRDPDGHHPACDRDQEVPVYRDGVLAGCETRVTATAAGGVWGSVAARTLYRDLTGGHPTCDAASEYPVYLGGRLAGCEDRRP